MSSFSYSNSPLFSTPFTQKSTPICIQQIHPEISKSDGQFQVFLPANREYGRFHGSLQDNRGFVKQCHGQFGRDDSTLSSLIRTHEAIIKSIEESREKYRLQSESYRLQFSQTMGELRQLVIEEEVDTSDHEGPVMSENSKDDEQGLEIMAETLQIYQEVLQEESAQKVFDAMPEPISAHDEVIVDFPDVVTKHESTDILGNFTITDTSGLAIMAAKPENDNAQNLLDEMPQRNFGKIDMLDDTLGIANTYLDGVFGGLLLHSDFLHCEPDLHPDIMEEQLEYKDEYTMFSLQPYVLVIYGKGVWNDAFLLLTVGDCDCGGLLMVEGNSNIEEHLSVSQFMVFDRGKSGFS